MSLPYFNVLRATSNFVGAETLRLASAEHKYHNMPAVIGKSLPRSSKILTSKGIPIGPRILLSSEALSPGLLALASWLVEFDSVEVLIMVHEQVDPISRYTNKAIAVSS